MFSLTPVITCGVRLLSTNQQLSWELLSLQVEPVNKKKWNFTRTFNKPNQTNMTDESGIYQSCSSYFPSHGWPIGGLPQTKAKVMAAFDWLVLEVDVTAGSGCCHDWLSRTCVQWAQGASWSLNLCTLLEGDRRLRGGPEEVKTIRDVSQYWCCFDPFHGLKRILKHVA